MTHLARPTNRPAPTKTRVVMMRPSPSSSVRRQEERDPLPLRLAIGVITAIGVVGLIWWLGYAGYRLGYASVIGLPELTDRTGEGLISGVMMLIEIPQSLVWTAVANPIWLLIGFALVAIPAAGLSAAKPATKGAPRGKEITIIMSLLAGSLAMINAALVIWWTASPLRSNLFRPLPESVMTAQDWLRGIQTSAGLDLLAAIATVLWVVLSFRLAIPIWLRALSSAASFVALGIVIVALAASSVAAAQLKSNRSVGFITLGDFEPVLLLGSTPHHTATFSIDQAMPKVTIIEPPRSIRIVDRRSIIDVMLERADFVDDARRRGLDPFAADGVTSD